MKTFEYKVNTDLPNEFTIFFLAANRTEADVEIKQRKKRNEKAEFVATHRDVELQRIPHKNHSTPESTEDWTLVYECPECDHQHAVTSVSSHAFMLLCPLCKKYWNTGADIEKQPAQEPITYTMAIYQHVQLPEFDMDGLSFPSYGER